MEPLATNIISELYANTANEDWKIQFMVLLGIAAISWLMRRRWNRVIDTRIASLATSGFENIALHATKRLSFSLSFAVLILISFGLFKSLGYPTSLLRLAEPLVLMLAAISILVFLLRVAAGDAAGTRRLELYISVALWIVCVFYLLGWLPVVKEFLNSISISLGEVRISVLGVIKFLIVSAVLLLIALALSRHIEERLRRTPALESGVRLGLEKVVRISLIGFAVLVALSIAGLNMTALSVIGGGLGIGIGFGLQKVVGNLISGFLILFDRSIRPGDVISIGESYGRVEKMGARYLAVRSRDGVETLIPNEEMITTRVVNWSYRDRHVRVKIPVQISYGDDPKLAMQLMLDAAMVNDRVMDDPKPVVNLMGFGDNGINLELRVWINDPEQGMNNVRSAINLLIWDAFEKNGITIPFPQRDLHLNGGAFRTSERAIITSK